MNELLLHYLGCSAFIILENKCINQPSHLPQSENHDTILGIDFWTKGAFNYPADMPDDPFDNIKVTKLLITHDHADHSFIPDGCEVLQGVKNNKIVENTEPIKIGDFEIFKFQSKHYPALAKKPKLNTVFKLIINGIRIVHMGDAYGTMSDPILLENLKSRLGDIDLLLTPIGSPQAKKIEFSILKQTIRILNPKAIVPMHYWSIQDKQDVLHDFTNNGFTVSDRAQSRLSISRDELNSLSEKTIWSLTPGKFITV